MNSIVTAYPKSLEERFDLGPEDQMFPGSFDDFVELIDKCDYQVEYHEDKIIAMSIASGQHEEIVSNILGIFFILFASLKELKRYGSNRHIYIRDFKCAYSPDASICKGKPEEFQYASGKNAYLNPWMIVEIVSKTSYHRDFELKLPKYKTILSLRHILYFEQNECSVICHSRDEKGIWEYSKKTSYEDAISIDDKEFRLGDIYENLTQ